MNKLMALLAGALFGVGLGVSGMLSPAKVIGFLDVFGQWDPTLAFVMGGGVLVALPAFQLALRRQGHPLLAPKFSLPTRNDIDGRLIAGTAIFGTGWAMAGLCPGPAIAGMASLQWSVFGFVIAMVVGQGLADRWTNRSTSGSPLPSV